MRICIAAASAIVGMAASTALTLGLLRYMVVPDVALLFTVGSGYLLTATMALALGHLYEKVLPCSRK